MAAGPAGGRPCGFDDADVAFINFGVFAATFDAALSKVGYADADADAASAGFCVGDFAGFGDFAGVGAGVALTFDAPLRLFASI